MGTVSKRTLFVGNLAYAATEQDLLDLAKEFGCMPSAVRISRHHDSKKPRGFAFLEFASGDQAAEAQAQLNYAELLGRQLRVSFAEERGGERR